MGLNNEKIHRPLHLGRRKMIGFLTDLIWRLLLSFSVILLTLMFSRYLFHFQVGHMMFPT